MDLALTLHLLAVAIWVGGMFFAYVALRPAAAHVLQGPFRLRLWNRVFAQFFPWVWLSIAALFATGYYIIFDIIGGFADTAIYIHLMHGLGIIMLLIFMHVFFAPYHKLSKAVRNEDWKTGAEALAQIRVLIAINLGIGIFTIVVAKLARFIL
ncbi:MAG: CopD family protein [Thiotrichaceae bacterium]|nr:CopD family protein [Thiotrichaceae bacterium]